MSRTANPDHVAAPHQSERLFDPAARAVEKQASRDADARALMSGEKTVEQLRRENAFAVPASDANARIDYRAIPRMRLR
ncbi:MAG: hypothetical protein QM756_12715 [Polyangiaceae bacterium]